MDYNILKTHSAYILLIGEKESLVVH